jgi:hypothetical protein
MCEIGLKWCTSLQISLIRKIYKLSLPHPNRKKLWLSVGITCTQKKIKQVDEILAVSAKRRVG